ncbi:MAG TPA: DUF6391 domain-containing protein [Aggregatilineales bacterium]|nr:DUF6391 domain-containing protein [Aggregatilineales bacterium]
MFQSLAEVARPVLDTDVVRRVRRVHGLEHATVHVLSGQIKRLSIAGRSDPEGFWLAGDVTTEQVERAAHEALDRMRAGEHDLAVHPNCGTSLLATGALTSLAAVVGSVGVRRGALDYVNRFSTVMLLMMGAVILSRPVGLQLQEHFTTLGEPGDLEIVGVQRRETTGPFGNPLVVHRISTIGG